MIPPLWAKSKKNGGHIILPLTDEISSGSHSHCVGRGPEDDLSPRSRIICPPDTGEQWDDLSPAPENI